MVFCTVAIVGLFAGVIFPQWHCKHIPCQIRFVSWRFNVVGDGTWAMRGRCKRDVFRDLEMCARWTESSIHHSFPQCRKLIECSMAPYCNFLMSLSKITLKLRPARSKTRPYKVDQEARTAPAFTIVGMAILEETCVPQDPMFIPSGDGWTLLPHVTPLDL